MSETMRVYFLGGSKSQEIPREFWETRGYDYDKYRERAIQIAPGVHVLALGHGDFILPGTHEADGRTYPNTGSGTQIAVWTVELRPPCEWCGKPSGIRLNGEYLCLACHAAYWRGQGVG